MTGSAKTREPRQARRRLARPAARKIGAALVIAVAGVGATAGISAAVSGSGQGGHVLRSGAAPSGTVTSVGKHSFTIVESDGTVLTIKTMSGTTYNLTQSSAVAHARVGTYVEAVGTVTRTGELSASAIAVVPKPPAFVAESGIDARPRARSTSAGSRRRGTQ